MAKAGHAYEQLDTAFRHGNFKPLYFFYGEERFLSDMLQQTLLDHALAPHERDFNLDIVYGAERQAQAVLALCASYPVMAARRVVIVRDFEKLRDNKLFKAYAEQPNPSAIVLLLCNSRPNLNTQPYRNLKQKAVWAEFKPLYANQVPSWIQKHVRGLGYQMGG